MKWQTISKHLLGTACLAVLVAVNALAEQQAELQDHTEPSLQDSSVQTTSCEKDCQCNGRCSSEYVCCPKAVEKEVKKSCWLVKPKLVCVPGFRWPWECLGKKNPSCGDDCDSTKPRCGFVRCINTLEKHEYTCKECGYEWTIKRVCCSNCGGNSSSCCCPECGCANCE